MREVFSVAAAAAAGAAAMYFLDPEQGRRRRALVRDKVVSASVHTSDAARARSRRVGHAMKGWTAGLASHLPFRSDTASPATLRQRVRSHLGRVVSHPKAVHVEVREDRTVCLSGHVLEDELESLIEHVERVPGVSRVDSQLTAHESAGNIPELQGERRRAASRGNGRFWRILAWTAPVAVLAATMRRPESPRGRLVRDLWSDRRPLPGVIARARRLHRSGRPLGAWRI